MESAGLLVIVFTVLVLLNTRQITVAYEFELGFKNILLSITHRSRHLEDMVDIEYDLSPIRHDSVGIDSFVPASIPIRHILGTRKRVTKMTKSPSRNVKQV